MGCLGSKEAQAHEESVGKENAKSTPEPLAPDIPKHVEISARLPKEQEQEQEQEQGAAQEPVQQQGQDDDDDAGLFEDARTNGDRAAMSSRSSTHSATRSGRLLDPFVRPSLSESLSHLVDPDSGQLHQDFSRQLCSFTSCSLASAAGSIVLNPPELHDAPFKLKQLIGEGGCGKVYLAEWMGKNVAIKVISGYSAILQVDDIDTIEDAEEYNQMIEDEKKEKMTQLEAVLMTVVDHPNLVKTFKVMATNVMLAGDGFQTSPSVYHYCIIMEHATQGSLWAALLTNRFHKSVRLEEGDLIPVGINLEAVCRVMDLIPEEPPVPPACPYELFIWDAWSCLELLMEVVSAVHYLHENHVLHGDLKVANVLLKNSDVDRRGFICKITDFGFSRIMKPRTQLTTQTYGTVTHMPPELLREGTLTSATDVYSIGIMMWEVYCAQGVYKDLQDAQVIFKVTHDNLRPHWPPGCPPRFSRLANECWKEDPPSRPTTEYILDELKAVKRELCPKGPESPRIPILGTPHVPRRRKKSFSAKKLSNTSFKSNSTLLSEASISPQVSFINNAQAKRSAASYSGTHPSPSLSFKTVTQANRSYSGSHPQAKVSGIGLKANGSSSSFVRPLSPDTSGNVLSPHGRGKVDAHDSGKLDAAQLIAMSMTQSKGGRALPGHLSNAKPPGGGGDSVDWTGRTSKTSATSSTNPPLYALMEGEEGNASTKVGHTKFANAGNG